MPKQKSDAAERGQAQGALVPDAVERAHDLLPNAAVRGQAQGALVPDAVERAHAVLPNAAVRGQAQGALIRYVAVRGQAQDVSMVLAEKKDRMANPCNLSGPLRVFKRSAIPPTWAHTAHGVGRFRVASGLALQT